MALPNLSPPLAPCPVLLGGLLLWGLTLSGCGPRLPGPGGPAGSPAGTSSPQAASTPITVEDGQGVILFLLTPTGNTYAVSGPSGTALGTVQLESDRARFTPAGPGARYRVKRKDTGFKLYREDVKGGTPVEIAAVKSKDGKFRVKDPQDRQLYEGKVKDQKAKVGTPGGAQWVLRAQPDGAAVEDSAGKRLARIQGLTSAPAAVFCAAPEYNVEEKAVVTAYCARFGP